MRFLFEIDTKDYIENGVTCVRPSARGIIIKDNKVAMIYSNKYGYYEFPGGGINNNESIIDAMIREVNEETGFIVDKNSIKEFGWCHLAQKGDPEDLFIQDNYFFIVNVLDKKGSTHMDKYEIEEGYELRFVDANEAIRNNLDNKYRYYDQVSVERDAKILQILLDEKYLK